MANFIAIFIGGGIGSIFRYSISLLFFQLIPNFPLATLLSNVISSFLAGLFFGMGVGRIEIPNSIKIFLITGFCGGFSTFSTFSIETVHLFNNGKEFSAFINVAGNLILCFSFVLAGLAVARKM